MELHRIAFIPIFGGSRVLTCNYSIYRSHGRVGRAVSREKNLLYADILLGSERNADKLKNIIWTLNL